MANEEVKVIFPNLNIDGNKIVEFESYKALQQIKAIIKDDSFKDKEYFMKIKEIVCLFEALGSDGVFWLIKIYSE